MFRACITQVNRCSQRHILDCDLHNLCKWSWQHSPFYLRVSLFFSCAISSIMFSCLHPSAPSRIEVIHTVGMDDTSHSYRFTRKIIRPLFISYIVMSLTTELLCPSYFANCCCPFVPIAYCLRSAHLHRCECQFLHIHNWKFRTIFVGGRVHDCLFWTTIFVDFDVLGHVNLGSNRTMFWYFLLRFCFTEPYCRRHDHVIHDGASREVSQIWFT